MRVLSSTRIDAVVGGNLVTGWVPRNWPDTELLRDFQISTDQLGMNLQRLTGVGVPGIHLPAFAVPQIQAPAVATFHGLWEC